MANLTMSIVWASQDEKFIISASKDMVIFEDLRDFLEHQVRWKGVTKAIWEDVIHESTAVLGVYKRQDTHKLTQVGFSRVISDGSRFTWLADFFILPAYQGAGLGKALLGALLALPYFKSRRQMVDVQGSTEVQSLLQRHGGFGLATIMDASTASTMYKHVSNKCPEHGPGIPVVTSKAGRLYHSVHKEYFISTNLDILQLSVIHSFLETTYWCPGIARELVEQEVAHSDCVALFYETSDDSKSKAEPKQVGFARWVTDRSTFAYLADVFVLKEHAGKGLGIWLVQQAHEMAAIRRMLPSTNAAQDVFSRLILLRTSTAQGLYSRYAGFEELRDGDEQDVKIMMRLPSQSVE